ncbi:hypothetical protein [Streptomyces sp. NPDC046161]|uniref:hypothetical protein n=1 Tax=Streptomyces sp. NPDC046161 TaxID=3155132 RepID=UPI003405FF01
MSAIRIDSDGATVVLPWPDDREGRLRVVRDELGGVADRAVYHRRAHLHVHGSGGRDGLAMNVTVWVLASHWRRVEIPYGFFGPVVVTGPAFTDLDEEMAVEVLAVCAAVREVRREWVTRSPVGESQARAELLAAAGHSVTVLDGRRSRA